MNGVTTLSEMINQDISSSLNSNILKYESKNHEVKIVNKNEFKDGCIFFTEYFNKSIKNSIDSLLFFNPTFIRNFYIEKINNIYEECKNQNWDGYNAKPIKKNEAERAKEFIYQLTIYLDDKYLNFLKIKSENDGHYCFDWFKNDKNQISISLHDNEYIFSMFFRDRKEYGEKEKSKQSINELISYVQKVCNG